ncbi:Pantothenate kinase type III, CoaX-like [hydrothermal vent metagenome]|uniref:Type III pantothenate kinase n=1 Tax=hydrothermal vent metagenome TaxID=652676 RepID=A0A3B1BEM5_9ZZZZ
MKALFDIGNSRIKWAWFEQSQKPAKGPFSLHDIGGAGHAECPFDEMAAVNWTDWPRPEEIVVSSVGADEHWRQLRDWCSQHWRQQPVRVTSVAEGYDICNAYARPDELGSDRWAAIIGAHHLRHTNTCVIDCGTAITVDFLDAAGRHLGGYIIPGLELMQQSLAQRTDAIQLLSQSSGSESGRCRTEPGSSTAACIEHGLLLTITSLIEVGCKKMEIQTGKLFHCLLTGGNAEQLAPCLGKGVAFEPHLVLQGLARIACEDHSVSATDRDSIKK